ncbi:hypothetical protein [Alienimonas chondri]|uniref:Uncharacterized protein n=1 Tax=Alienimonas chondri TaxID=2681879 RepID=A0ABX1VD97_9PLAN|nr:hypothetical protein [Alienimonas chondri]NNJ26080.1 hypothetical protein [Alienimonas chondri]
MFRSTLGFTRRHAFACAFMALCGTWSAAPASAEDSFDGAVWRVKLTSKKEPSKVRHAQFRMAESVLYQKVTRTDPTYSKRVGKNFPDGRRTRFEVEDFRVRLGRKDDYVTIKGTGRMTPVKVGRWHGLFTDGRGDNWDLVADRIEE